MTGLPLTKNHNKMFCYVLFILVTVVTSYRVQYALYTPEHQNSAVLIGPNNASKYIDKAYPIRIFIHGWNSDPSVPFYPLLKKALFSRGNFNIIQVNYSEFAHQNYITAARESPKIATKITHLILNITKDGYPLNNIELIGHSLGAQISGNIGEIIKKQTSQTLSKITALDPAGPFFQLVKINGRSLDKSDADVVYAIHTDRNALGTLGSVGTTDVYANGGVGPQPGCSPLLGIFSCSHRRSWMYFTNATANPGSILAAKCDSSRDLDNGKCNNTRIIDLGGDITSADAGKYYTKTNSEAPFKSVIPEGK